MTDDYTATTSTETDYSGQRMYFNESDESDLTNESDGKPYVEIDNGEHFDLYYYGYDPEIKGQRIFMKPNYRNFGKELEKRWNKHELLIEKSQKCYFYKNMFYASICFSVILVLQLLEPYLN